jgi:hypothetical protein
MVEVQTSQTKPKHFITVAVVFGVLSVITYVLVGFLFSLIEYKAALIGFHSSPEGGGFNEILLYWFLHNRSVPPMIAGVFAALSSGAAIIAFARGESRWLALVTGLSMLMTLVSLTL